MEIFSTGRTALRDSFFLPEDKVAVCIDRNPMFHVVLFGILRSCGCYVPVSREHDEEA
ncbi:hypothetical protein EDD15DRAFT_2211895 [Pisolithus albus]|nr:hypothetical protein EDD15DRAFT_2211895 [Pisolithus albus]